MTVNVLDPGNQVAHANLDSATEWMLTPADAHFDNGRWLLWGRCCHCMVWCLWTPEALMRIALFAVRIPDEVPA